MEKENGDMRIYHFRHPESGEILHSPLSRICIIRKEQPKVGETGPQPAERLWLEPFEYEEKIDGITSIIYDGEELLSKKI
jgi:hypothetical protein